jgi:hypothetical protein
MGPGEGQHRPLTRETETVNYVQNKLKQKYVIREGWWESKSGEVKAIGCLELRAHGLKYRGSNKASQRESLVRHQPSAVSHNSEV